jgi:tRNA dimethylallyltransferase
MQCVSRTEPLLIAVVGPTAVGKTSLSLALATHVGGEIISADSRQIYRHLTIGTAKPTPDEMRQVPHHLIDIIDPDVWMTLGEYQARAYAAIENVLASGRVPLLVGGTGQYVRAVVEGWGIPAVAPQPDLRADLEKFAEERGPRALHERLKAVDPAAAEAIDQRNVRRVVRALEVYLVTGEPISALQERHPPPYRILQIGLTRPRPILYARADARIERMIEAGFVDEVKGLLAMGYDWALPSMSSLGYTHIGAYLRSEMTLEEAVANLKRDTRRLIRSQYNWFRLTDPKITWFDLESVETDQVLAYVSDWLNAQAS